jgi:hypothetical protein
MGGCDGHFCVQRCFIFLLAFVAGAAWANEADQQSNLLSLGAGTIIVRAPVSYADFENWSPMSLIDELLKTGCD